MFDQEKFVKSLLKLALDANFYGKRKRDTKLETCEDLRPTLVKNFGQSVPEANQLVDWLDDNKPAKAANKKARLASNKLAFNTESGAMKGHTENIKQAIGNCFILCTAQNNTALEGDFLTALELYAHHKNAEILVSPTEYARTLYETGTKGEVFYSERVRPYLVDSPVRLYNDLIFAAELMLNPTVTRPTNGLQGYHGENSVIVPHVKIELQSYPTPQDQTPKFVWTTGTLTKKNYIQRAAGQKSEAHHCISALIAEPCHKSAKGYQVRQLHWVNGSFIDLGTEVSATEIKTAPRANAFSMGDIHSEKIDLIALDVALGLASELRVKNIFAHDLLDFESRNHHNRHDHIFLAGMGDQSVKDDLQMMAGILREIADCTDQVYICRSNHDEALDRWLRDPKYNFMQDPINARLYLDLQSKMYEFIENGEKVPDILEIALQASEVEYPENAVFLTRQDVVKIQGVVLSDHGDCGANGSRGTPAQLAKTYSKATTGHTHSASIIMGIYTSGVTGSLKMGYNEKGASSWSHAHTIQYANGSRALLIF